MEQIIAIVEQYLAGVELQKFTEEQKGRFGNNYNCKLYFFEYALNGSGDLIIRTDNSNYTSLQYYMGFDKVNNDSIKLKIELGETVVVVYNIKNERVAGLAQKLDLIK